MHCGVHLPDGGRVVAVAVDLVLDSEGAELLVPDERRGLRLDPGRASRPFEQDRLHLAPRGLVPDADREVDDDALVLRQRAVVDDLAVEDDRVRDHDLLVLEGADVRGQEPHLADEPRMLADLHAITDPEGPPECQAQARHQVPDDRGRA